MKKLFAIAIATAVFTSCGDTETDNNSIASPGSSSTENQQTAHTAYAPADGDVTLRDGKLLVMKNGDWKEADAEVKLNNGIIVYKDGRVKKDDKEITLQDGEVVSEDGDVFDRTGNAVESAWEDTKEGVKDAGKEIEKGAKKAGDKVEDAVDDDRNK